MISIFFLYEAHFYLNGSVSNKQNYRHWSKTQPQLIKQKPLHPQRVTVWCGLSAERVIGPYFFEDSAGGPITIDQHVYHKMLT